MTVPMCHVTRLRRFLLEHVNVLLACYLRDSVDAVMPGLTCFTAHWFQMPPREERTKKKKKGQLEKE